MNALLPHYVNIATKLKSYGIETYNEPMMFILGGNIVTAEIDARKALQRLSTVVEPAVQPGADLDAFDTGHLDDAAQAIAVYQRARRDLLHTADQLGLLQAPAAI